MYKYDNDDEIWILQWQHLSNCQIVIIKTFINLFIFTDAVPGILAVLLCEGKKWQNGLSELNKE